MKYSGIGGQAVIEGIMMMKGEDYAVAVRRPDKEIEVKKTHTRVSRKRRRFYSFRLYAACSGLQIR